MNNNYNNYINYLVDEQRKKNIEEHNRKREILNQMITVVIVLMEIVNIKKR